MITGLFIIAAAVALVGWALSIVVWRWRVGAKWRRRHRSEVRH
jgi:uncharacterized protein (DUF2062 family)